MYIIGQKCYNKFLAPKHNWVLVKVCNWALKLIIKRRNYTANFVTEQQKVHGREYTEEDLIAEMTDAHPYTKKLSEYLWAYYTERDMLELP